MLKACKPLWILGALLMLALPSVSQAACFNTNYVGAQMCGSRAEAYSMAQSEMANFSPPPDTTSPRVEPIVLDWNRLTEHGPGHENHPGYAARAWYSGGWTVTGTLYLYEPEIPCYGGGSTCASNAEQKH